MSGVDRVALQEKAADLRIILGEHFLSFEISEFGKMYEEKAREELRETPNIVEEAMISLKKLINDEPGLAFPIEDEALLMSFLRPCKHYPDSAFAKVRKYYKFKSKHPKYYDNLLPSVEKAAFLQSLLTVLPHRTKNGERVLIIQAGRKWNTKKCTVVNLLRSVIMVLEAALNEPRTQVSGAQVILDMEGLCMQHVWQFGPVIARDIVEFVQECVPLRLKGVHIVNQPYIFNMLFAIFKPFLDEKLRSRIHFHGNDFASLHTHIERDILPLPYDGTIFVPMDVGEQIHAFVMNFEVEFKVKMHEGYVREKK